MDKQKISVVVPVYQEDLVVREFYQRITNVLNNLKLYDYELIFVNDGSIDNTLNILKEICFNDKKVKIVSFSRNFGHQIAITAGIDRAKGDIVIIIDADLQDPPELIPELINKWKSGYNVVYAKRKKRKGETIFKKLTASIFYRVLKKITEIDIPLDTGDYRLVDKKVFRQLKNIREKNRFIRGIISWIGFKQTYVLYERSERYAGNTKYSLRKMIKFSLDGVTSFSKSPLKITLNLGFISIIIGIFLAVYVIIEKIFFPGKVVTGWASTIITIIFFSGIQLLAIGLIGEYIGRIYEEIQNRPLYIVDEEINF